MTSDANGRTEPKDAAAPQSEAGALLGKASETELRMLRLFNHYRHDWMNDIQLLFGYVKLKKFDKLPALMEKITHKVQQEGLVSRLGVPTLILHLLSFQAEVKELKLELLMEREVRLDELDCAPDVCRTVEYVLEAFRNEASLSQDGNSELTLYWNREAEELEVKAIYNGEYREGSIRQAESDAAERSGRAQFAAFYESGRAEWSFCWSEGAAPASHT